MRENEFYYMKVEATNSDRPLYMLGRARDEVEAFSRIIGFENPVATFIEGSLVAARVQEFQRAEMWRDQAKRRKPENRPLKELVYYIGAEFGSAHVA